MEAVIANVAAGLVTKFGEKAIKNMGRNKKREPHRKAEKVVRQKMASQKRKAPKNARKGKTNNTFNPKRKQGVVRNAVNDLTAGDSSSVGGEKSIGISETPSAYSATQKNVVKMTPLHTHDGQGVNLVGQEFLDVVPFVPNAASSGTILYHLILNPTVWQLTKAQKYAQMYQKYRIKAMEFIYVPAVGTTVTGQFSMAVIDDPAIVSQIVQTSGTGTIRELMSCRVSEQFQVYQPTTLSWKPKKGPPLYTIVAPETLEGNLANQAVFLVAIVVDSNNITSSFGTITIKYNIEYYDPLLVPAIRQGAASSVNMLTQTATPNTLMQVPRNWSTNSQPIPDYSDKRLMAFTVTNYFQRNTPTSLSTNFLQGTLWNMEIGGLYYTYNSNDAASTASFVYMSPQDAIKQTNEFLCNQPGLATASTWVFGINWLFPTSGGSLGGYTDKLAEATAEKERIDIENDRLGKLEEQFVNLNDLKEEIYRLKIMLASKKSGDVDTRSQTSIERRYPFEKRMSTPSEEY